MYYRLKYNQHNYYANMHEKLPFSINKSTHAKPQRHSSHLTCRLNANKQTNTVRTIMEIMSL